MSRERFESTEDRVRQAQLCEAIKRTYKLALKPLANAHYTLDFFAYDPKGCVGKAWVEVKYRNIEWTKFDAIMLSAGKWRDGVSLSQTTGLPFVLFFQFKDGNVYRYTYEAAHVSNDFMQGIRSRADTTKQVAFGTNQPVEKNGVWSDGKLYVSPGVWTEWGGRWVDDRDGQDSEPVVMIPRSLWEPVAIEPEPERDASFDKAAEAASNESAPPPAAEGPSEAVPALTKDEHPF